MLVFLFPAEFIEVLDGLLNVFLRANQHDVNTT